MKKVIKYIKKLSPNQFFDEVKDKTSIFLHHTAGSNSLEAVNWWEQTPDRVGTALLVDRNGDPLQCFEINRWAYHLGVTTGTGKTTRQSVGIEIASYGFVFPEGEGKDLKYYAYPMYPNKSRKVLIANDQVIKLDKPFRGFQYWHKYTDEQVETIVELCRYLVDRFKIKVQANLDNFWEYNADVIGKDLPGIWSHTTVRKDKFDIFPQPNLIEALKKEFNSKPKTS